MKIFILYLVICITIPIANAFAPPAFGLGALFRPPNIKIIKSEGGADRLEEAGKFFVDAFWRGKVGGATTLSQKQAYQLERQQVAEFNKRYRRRGAVIQSGRLPGNYAGRSYDSSAELVLCVNGSGDVIGCAGVEGEITGIVRIASVYHIYCIYLTRYCSVFFNNLQSLHGSCSQ